MSMIISSSAPGGVLQMLFETDAWDSTISIEPGISVTLTGGTLELVFAGGANLASQIGRTFDLFDWTGVAPIGEFNIVSPYLWEASRLYSAGEMTFVGEVSEPASGKKSHLHDRTRSPRSPAILPKQWGLPRTFIAQ